MLQSHLKATKYRNKSVPLYEDLSIVYAKDHANGKDAKTPNDVVEELEKEKNENSGMDGLDDIVEDDLCAPTPSIGTKKKKEATNVQQMIIEGMRKM